MLKPLRPSDGVRALFIQVLPTWSVLIKKGSDPGSGISRKKGGSRPVSRVLSWAIIHLGPPSPIASCNLPESAAGHDIAFLFGLAPGGVYLATECYHLCGALLPHHFTLTNSKPRPKLAVYFLLHFP